MLKKEWVIESSPQINKIHPNIADSSYGIYRGLSNYIHGNFLNKEHHGNEKMWVLSEIILLSILISELISVKILDGGKRNEITDCVIVLSKKSNEFLQMWKNRIPRKE